MTDARSQSPTSAEAVAQSEVPTLKTLTIDERIRDIAARAGHLRYSTSMVNSDAAELQHEAVHIQLDIRTAHLAQQEPATLLEQLSDMGFAWRDIARMVGVSVPALRRWRTGELPSGQHRRGVAQLLAFAETIRDELVIFEPASWMEVPISGEAPTTPIDLYAAGQLDTVFDLASEHCTPEEALDQAEPGWRDKYRSDWEVDTAEDGQPYIRLKSEQ
jgi:hypothetical protein